MRRLSQQMGTSRESTLKVQISLKVSCVPSKGGAGAKVARRKENPSLLLVASLFHSQQSVRSE